MPTSATRTGLRDPHGGRFFQRFWWLFVDHPCTVRIRRGVRVCPRSGVRRPPVRHPTTGRLDRSGSTASPRQLRYGWASAAGPADGRRWTSAAVPAARAAGTPRPGRPCRGMMRALSARRGPSTRARRRVPATLGGSTTRAAVTSAAYGSRATVTSRLGREPLSPHASTRRAAGRLSGPGRGPLSSAACGREALAAQQVEART